MDRDRTSPVIEYASRRDRKRQRDPGVWNFLRRASDRDAEPSVDPNVTDAVAKPTTRSELERMMGRLAPEDMLIITRFIEYLAAERRSTSESDGGYPSVYRQMAAAGDPVLGEVPVAVLVGPCKGLPEIETLSDALEAAPNLAIVFRAFHGGFYRLDGRAESVNELGAWISELDGVESVTLDRATIHVVPRKTRS